MRHASEFSAVALESWRGGGDMGVRLEDLTPAALVSGLAGDRTATVVAVRWIGSNALHLTYRTEDGSAG